MFLSERIQPPNDNCQTCALGLFILSVNSSCARLDLIVSLIEETIYTSQEFSIFSGGNCLYDPELHSLSNRTLADLGFLICLNSIGLKEGSILLILPEEDDFKGSLLYVKLVYLEFIRIFRCDGNLSTTGEVPFITTVLPLVAKNITKKQKISNQGASLSSDNEDLEII